MARLAAYRLCMVLLGALFFFSCDEEKPDGIDWSVTLDHSSKKPYGSSLAFETLPAYFPAARREPLTKWFRYTSVDEHMYGGYDSATLLVLLGLDCYISNEEWNALLRYVKAGNELFVLSSNLDMHFSRALHCTKVRDGQESYPLSQYDDGSSNKDALSLPPDTNKTWGYTGRNISSYFELSQEMDADTLLEETGSSEESESYDIKVLESSIDTVAGVLGVHKGSPNFIRYKVGSGHITLHAAPLVLSNYFLLQQGNRDYLDAIWHSFPANISAVYWNEYYKRTTEKSSMSVLWKYPAMRWALLIALGALLLYVLFGLKRLQRIVPVTEPVENTSVSFVETVGRLYFNKGNHGNLAEKMTQHFLEWVRNNYYLDTNQLGDQFVRQLAAKSGKTEGEAAAIVQMIHDVRLHPQLTSERLYEFHHAIQSFYNAH